MAHSLDTSAQIAAATSNPQSASYTCGAGATLLVVTLIYANGTRTGAPTFNGVALTQADQTRYVTEARAEIWYLLNPPTGSAYTLSVPNPSGLSLEVCISSYAASAGKKTIYHTAGGRATTFTNPYAPITTQLACLLVGAVASGANEWAPSARAGTQLYDTDNGTWGGGHQYYNQPSEGATNLSWTFGTSEDYGAVVAAFYEADPATYVSKSNVYEVLGPPKALDVSKTVVYEVLQPIDPGLSVSKAVVYEVLHEQSTPSSSGDLSDILGLTSDSIIGRLIRARMASVSSTLKAPTDLLYPPPVEATHIAGVLDDSAIAITDSILADFLHDYTPHVTDAAGVITDAISAGLLRLDTPGRWVAPVTITAQRSTIDPLRVAAHPVRHPSYYFAPKIKSYGTFTRAISAPVGFVKTGDVSLTVVDADNSIRYSIAAKTIRKADAEMKLGPEGGRLSAFLRPWKRRVGTVTQPADGELSINLQDHTFEFLEKTIKGCVNVENFPDMPEGAGSEFVPIPIGIIASEKGAFRAPLVDTINHRYAVSRNPIVSVDAVYRKGGADDDFVLVDPSEYTLRQDIYIDHGEGSGDYCALLEFSADQGSAEIRVNVHGVCDDDGNLTHTNFADMFLGMFNYLAWANNLNDVLNLASFDATRIACSDLHCAGVVTRAITWGELISQVQRSCNIDVFADKNDRIAIHYTTDDEEPRLSLDDVMRLFKGSVSQQLAEPTYNRIPYKYCPNYASGKWTENVWDNLADQDVLGEITEAEPLQMHWVRDADTAAKVVERRGEFLDLDAFRFEGDIPLIPVLEKLELGDLVEISHFGGMRSGGYTAEQFKILELMTDIDHLKYRFKGIRRRIPPPHVVASDISADLILKEGGDGPWLDADGAQFASEEAPRLLINARPGPFAGTTDGELFGIFLHPTNDHKLIAIKSSDYGKTWRISDEANEPTLASGMSHAYGLTGETSFDCVVADGSIHVASQETDGRVCYHRYDMDNHVWAVTNQVISGPSPSIGSFCVSIEPRHPDGRMFVYFQGPRVLVSGLYYERRYVSSKIGDSWTTPVIVTPDPGSYPENQPGSGYLSPKSRPSSNCLIERIISGRDNRMHCFYAVDPAVCWVSNADYYAVTLSEDMIASSRAFLIQTNFMFVPTARNLGGFAHNSDRSIIYLLRRVDFSQGWVESIVEGFPCSHASWRVILESSYFAHSDETDNPNGFLSLSSEDDALLGVLGGKSYAGIVLATVSPGSIEVDSIAAGPAIEFLWLSDRISVTGSIVTIKGIKYTCYFLWDRNDRQQFRWLRVDKLPYTE